MIGVVVHIAVVLAFLGAIGVVMDTEAHER